MPINLGPTRPLNPANQSGSMTANPGGQGTKMNFNKTPAQNIQGRMTFKPPPNPQPNMQRGSLSPSPNIGSGQNNQYGNPAPYMNVRGSNNAINPSMSMMGMMNNKSPIMSLMAPQMGIVSQMPMNPALGINPSVGQATTGQGFNEQVPPGNNGFLAGDNFDANTGMGQLPSFTQFQEPNGAPPAPPMGNPMMNGGTNIGPSPLNLQNLMGRVRRF